SPTSWFRHVSTRREPLTPSVSVPTSLALRNQTPRREDDDDPAAPDQAPSPTRVVPASYTDEARSAGFQGKIFITVYVSAEGVPERIEPTSPIPFDLERTIRPAVLQWRFRPASSRRVAVPGKAIVEVPFR